MRSKMLFGLVAMLLVAVMAMPAMAAPITWTFSGMGDGLFDDLGVSFLGSFSYSVTGDTSNIFSGNMTDIAGNTVPVYYLADPTSANGGLTGGTLTLNGIDPTTGAPISVSETILEELYVAFAHVDKTIGFGIWDPTLVSGPGDIPLAGDLISAFETGSINFWMSVGPVSTVNYIAAGTVTLATSGLFSLEFIDGAAPDNPFGSITYQSVTNNVPEPSMFLLFGAGMLGFGMLRKRF